MYVEEDIGMYLGMILSGESVPGVGKYLYGKRSSFIGLNGMDGREWEKGDFCGNYCANCIAI